MTKVMRVPAFALIALLTMAEAVFAQAPRSRSQRVDPLTSSIRGRVTTADTGAPIRGAEVRLSIDGRFNRLVTSDGEGRFEMRSLPAGVYKLIVSKTGFITLEFGQRRAFETASTITVGEGQTATGNVALIRGGAIFGRLLDPFGDPSVGTRVQVLRARTEEGRRRLLPVGAADSTDDTGAFRVYGLPPGDYYVSASTGLIDAVKRDPPVYYPGTMNFADAQPLTLGVGAEASADFQIVDGVRTARISGVVMNASGAPVAAMVNLRSETIGLGPSSESALQLHDDAAADGSFTIQNVPPGPYTLTAMVMPMPTANPAPISGSFTETNAALRQRILSTLPQTVTMPIVVASEDVSGLALVTQAGGRISGQFVADTGVVRQLPRGLHVTLRGLGLGGMSMNAGRDDTNFELAGVGGPARLDVQGVPEGWAIKAIMLDGNDVTDQAFEVAGQTGAVRVIMTDRVTTLSGAIQSNSDIRDHNVVVFPEDAAKWTFPSRYVRTVRANAEGRFRIEGLPPERYLAAAVDYLENGQEQDRQLLERLRSRATSVTLGEGEQRSIQLDVIGR